MQGIIDDESVCVADKEGWRDEDVRSVVSMQESSKA